MLYLATGFVLGPWGLGFVHLDPMEHIAWFHHGAELAVTVSLFTVVLKLRLRPDAPALRPALFLAFGSMTITVALVATTPVVLLGWSWGAAILLGAIVAPTDPVLASDVRRRHFRDRDSARLTLTTEAGLNDGTTFPFVMLGLALLRGENPGVGGWRWWANDVLWAEGSGLGIGALVVYSLFYAISAGLPESLAAGWFPSPLVWLRSRSWSTGSPWRRGTGPAAERRGKARAGAFPLLASDHVLPNPLRRPFPPADTNRSRWKNVIDPRHLPAALLHLISSNSLSPPMRPAPSLSLLWPLLAAILLNVATLRADYRGALALDASTGAVLIEENADTASPPASVTKLMTFLVVHDAIVAGRVRLDTPITATAADQAMGGTQVHLAAGETFPVEELLYALMVESANDAAHALTQILGGREAFVAAMNARARSLGMNNTVFRSPHGLPPDSRRIEDGDLTTARDLALLSRELLTHTDVLRYSSTRVRPFGAGVRTEPLPMRNHNKLLESREPGSVPGCDGLKTGFTKAAGFCLAATAQRDGKRIIVTVMGSPDRRTRDAHVKRLIEEGLAKIPAGTVFQGPPTPITPVAAEATPIAPLPAESAGTGAPDQAPPRVEFKLPSRR